VKAVRGLAVLCALGFGACAAESDGQNQDNIGMGAQGGIGGAGGATGGIGAAGMMMPAGMGGAAGMVMTGSGGVGGDVMATGGVGGDVMTTGGVGGMMTGGMGGSGGMEMTTGGMGGSGGMEMMTGGMGGDGAPDKGMGDGSDVITIGDSFMNLNQSEGTQYSLEKVSGRDYRNYGYPGTQLLNGAIPGQFDSAVIENPNIKTVVISAGGNDILLGMITCTFNWTEACNEQVRRVAAAHTEFRQEMGAMGVEDVIWVHYGYSTSGVSGLHARDDATLPLHRPGRGAVRRDPRRRHSPDRRGLRHPRPDGLGCDASARYS
jgi:hypothetical protein